MSSTTAASSINQNYIVILPYRYEFLYQIPLIARRLSIKPLVLLYRTGAFSRGGCALLLFHRDPDLAIVVLILSAVLKLAGVAVQLHVDAGGDLVVLSLRHI